MDDRKLLKKAREDYVLGSDYAIRDLFDRFEQMLDDKEPQSIVWEPKAGEEYYAVNAAGSAYQGIWNGSNHNQALLRYHNIYKTHALAVKAAQHQRRYNMVLQAVLNLEPDQKVDWGDEDQRKYQVYFCHAYKQWISPPYGAICTENGWPALTDKKNLQPLLDRLNAKEQENG